MATIQSLKVSRVSFDPKASFLCVWPLVLLASCAGLENVLSAIEAHPYSHLSLPL